MDRVVELDLVFWIFKNRLNGNNNKRRQEKKRELS